MVCTFMLVTWNTDYVIHGISGPIAFLDPDGDRSLCLAHDLRPRLLHVGPGKAAVYKHSPDYWTLGTSAPSAASSA